MPRGPGPGLGMVFAGKWPVHAFQAARAKMFDQMLRNYGCRLAVLALDGLILAGCRSPSGSVTGAEKSAGASAAEESSEDRNAQRVASAHAHYAAALIHEMNEEPEAALDEYYQAALGDSANEQLVLEVSRRLIQGKASEKALKLLTTASAQPEASGAIFARLGVVYAQAGQSEQAMAANRRAIRKDPAALTGYQNLFLNHLQAKKPHEALAVLDQAAKQANVGPDFLVGLAELYMTYGAQVPAQKEAVKTKALAALTRAAKMNPQGPRTQLQLADGLNSLGASDQAAERYLELLKTLPDVPQLRDQIRRKLTDIYLRSEDRQKALEQLEAMVRDDPTSPQLQYFLGGLLLDAKKPAEAADHLSKTILLNANFDQAYYDLAIAQLEQQQFSAALATLEKARTLFAQNFTLEFLTAAAYSRQKAYTQAIAHYTAAEIVGRVMDPARLNENFYFQFGIACERNNDLEQAEKYFEKCLQLAPDMAEVLNYLGYMWADHGTKLERARELIEKAVKADPKNAAYLDSLGWVLFKLSQPQEALDYILKAAAMEPEPDATIYDHLGDIYAALNQPEKAREAWNKSLTAEANDVVRKKLETAGSK